MFPATRRRLWCETLPYDELTSPRVLGLLSRYGVEVMVAVRPWHVAEIGEVVRRLEGAGVGAALWPMIEDAHGRWASARSATAFIGFVDELLAAVPEAREVAIDLEPAIAELEKWKAWRPRWGQRAAERAGTSSETAGAEADPPSWRARAPSPVASSWPAREAAFLAASSSFSAAIARWRQPPAHPARRVTTALLPLLAFDTASSWLARLLGTPADELPVDVHSVMAYTSLFEGWSRGLVGRRRAEWMLGLCARRARTRWGARAGLSLGAVGTGAFGDEPVYRAPAELARDVAIARAAAISDLSLFDLGGVLRRAPAEAWLDAFCS